jgi:hypothetical protein
MRQWDDDSNTAVVDAALRILVVTYSIERMIQTVRGSAAELMRHAGHRETSATSVSGLPCAAEIVWDSREDDAREVLTHATEPQPNASLHDEPPSRPA